MSRKSYSTEELARDLLIQFLLTKKRQPLLCFLKLVFSGHIPSAFRSANQITVEKEVECFGGSRADILIRAGTSVLCVEVKVDAVEQLGQYIKYRDFFLSQNNKVYIAGLINRYKGHRSRNDNDPFFDFLHIRRVLWSEMIADMEQNFGNSTDFKKFVAELKRLDSGIGAYPRCSVARAEAPNDCKLLATNNWALMQFYKGLNDRFSGWDAVPNKYGNAPYELHLGKKSWASLFDEFSCRRIVLGLNQPRAGKIHSQPYFAPGVMLWNRTWFSNESRFLSSRSNIASHFVKLGYQVVRNEGSSWHRNQNWNPPYQVHGIKHANAFWENHFSLTQPEYCRLGWDKTLDRIEKEIRKLEKHIDSIKF